MSRVVIAALGLLVGLVLFFVGLLAATDPEGRGGPYILAGLVGAGIATVCIVYLLFRFVVSLIERA